MNPARIAIIVFAGVAAIVLALFVRGIYVRPKAPTVAAAAPAQLMTRVLVAKVDLAVGESLTRDNMSWQDWPAATYNAAYITDGAKVAAPPSDAAGAISKAKATVTDMATGGGPNMQAMIGAIVREPIYAGEPITNKKIVRSGDSSYMAVRLPEGMRAMALPITAESGAGGFIEPGDRIDILSSHGDGNGGKSDQIVVDTVLSNVLVLAVNTDTAAAKTGAQPVQGGSTVTLEIPIANVPTVARAHAQGGLTLVLRSYADAGGGTQGPVASADGRTVRVFKAGAPEMVTVQ